MTAYNKSMRLPMMKRPPKLDTDKMITNVVAESSTTFHDLIIPPRILMKVKPSCASGQKRQKEF